MPYQNALPPKPGRPAPTVDMQKIRPQRIEEEEEEADASQPQYIHEYLSASTITEERVLGIGAPKEKASVYPFRAIQAHLNKRASDGLRLAFMEPHWHYGREYISAAMSITRPLAIIGWYLTFEKVD